MTVAVIVPCFNRYDLTVACVASLEQHSPDAQIVLVDNGSTDLTSGLAVTHRNPVNQGFARGCNQGAASTYADVLVFLNNDTEVTDGWLPPLVEHASRPEVGCVGSRLLYGDGTVQHAGVRVSFERPYGHEAWNLTSDWTAAPTPVDAVTGACLAIRSELFWELGAFDEGYWNGYEDVDLCLNATRHGHLNLYEPRSVVVHHESQSGPERWSKVPENVMRLRAKWGPR
jgi:GT2 family glycosyltransferase